LPTVTPRVVALRWPSTTVVSSVAKSSKFHGARAPATKRAAASAARQAGVAAVGIQIFPPALH
jgi:hypothetical protein